MKKSCEDCNHFQAKHQSNTPVSKAHIWIASPASARANNGNWQSASRWARFLRTRYRVTIAQQWLAKTARPRRRPTC
jgi:type IV secretory pathway TrbL component